jgi:GAF domain-containing protein
VGQRYKETIGLVGHAAKSGHGILVTDTAADKRWSHERYVEAGHEPHSIAVAPVRHGRRNLGALELSDHLDGGPLTEQELHAMVYVAEQFGAFLDERGVFLTKEAAQEHAKEAAKSAQRNKRR